MHRTLIAIAAVATLAAGVAHAQSFDTPQETVKIAGVDMSNKAAVQGLLNRLEEVSLDVCGAPFGSDRNYVQTVKRSDCFAHALGAAVATAHVHALDVAYAERLQKANIQVAAR